MGKKWFSRGLKAYSRHLLYGSHRLWQPASEECVSNEKKRARYVIINPYTVNRALVLVLTTPIVMSVLRYIHNNTLGRYFEQNNKGRRFGTHASC